MPIDVLHGDCRSVLREIPSGTASCCVTSPPYWQQRDYGHPDQIGMEATPAEYVAELVSVFREVGRVLRDDGTLWLNLGDSYGKGKQLLGIPWRVAFAIQDDGWILRSEIIWNKSAHKPEKVKDRPTNSHERIFLFSRSKTYYYDHQAVAVPSQSAQGRPQRRRAEELARAAGLTPDHLAAIRACGITDVGKARKTQSGTGKNTPAVQALADEAKRALGGYYREFLIGDTVNLRTVWNVEAKMFPGAHMAVFPPALIEPCIKAGCPMGETVIDPFAGAGTTGLVARQQGRKAILIELSQEYAEMGRARLGLAA